MSGADSTLPIDERLGRLSEELCAMLAAREVIDVDALAERFALTASDVDDCVRAVEAFDFCVGEEAPSNVTQHEIPKPTLPQDYALGEELGRGGMGIVYRAHQESLGRDVAIKVLRPGDLVFGDALARFRSEARSLARLRHRHIVSVHEVGESTEGFLYYTMDLVEGETLAASISKGTSKHGTTPTRAVKWLRQVASAITHAHGQGVIHRDLKPQNILVDTDGDAFVVDFGLARDASALGSHTLTGQLLGTPAYMSPEQAKGDSDQIGEATDIWALGAILYECLTGRSPFAGKPLHETIQAILHDEPIAPRKLDRKVPQDLETICLKALSKRSEDRYPSVTAFQEDLDRFVEGRPIRAQQPSQLTILARAAGRNRIPLIAAVLATVLAILAFVIVVTPSQRVTWQLDAAERAFNEGSPKHASAEARAAIATARDNATLHRAQLLAIRAQVDEASRLDYQGDAKGRELAKELLDNPVYKLLAYAQASKTQPFAGEELRFEWRQVNFTLYLLAGKGRLAIAAFSPAGEEHYLRLFDQLDSTRHLTPWRHENIMAMLGTQWRGTYLALTQRDSRRAAIDFLPDLLDAAGRTQERAGYLSLDTFRSTCLELWSPQLEATLAEIASDLDRPKTTRAIALDALTELTGLPKPRITNFEFTNPSNQPGETLEDYLQPAHKILNAWRRTQDASRRDQFVIRTDLGVLLHSLNWTRGWSLLSHCARTPDKSGPSDEEWWQERRDQDPNIWLAENLGTTPDADLQTRLNIMFGGTLFSRAAEQFVLLAVPESTVVPGCMPTHDDEMATTWLDRLNVHPSETYRVRLANLVFENGSSTPSFFEQATSEVTVGEEFAIGARVELPYANTTRKLLLASGGKFVSYSYATFHGALIMAGVPLLNGDGDMDLHLPHAAVPGQGLDSTRIRVGPGEVGTGHLRSGAYGDGITQGVDALMMIALEPSSAPATPWTIEEWKQRVSASFSPPGDEPNRHNDPTRPNSMRILADSVELFRKRRDPFPTLAAAMWSMPEAIEQLRSPQNTHDRFGYGLLARLLAGDESAMNEALPRGGSYALGDQTRIHAQLYTRILLGSPSADIRAHAIERLRLLQDADWNAGVIDTLRRVRDASEFTPPDWLDARIDATPTPGLWNDIRAHWARVLLIIFGNLAVLATLWIALRRRRSIKTRWWAAVLALVLTWVLSSWASLQQAIPVEVVATLAALTLCEDRSGHRSYFVPALLTSVGSITLYFEGTPQLHQFPLRVTKHLWFILIWASLLTPWCQASAKARRTLKNHISLILFLVGGSLCLASLFDSDTSTTIRSWTKTIILILVGHCTFTCWLEVTEETRERLQLRKPGEPA